MMNMAGDNVISDWLLSFGTPEYTQAFIDNGYDDLEVCKQIGELDLDAIGVEDSFHRELILSAVAYLRQDRGSCVYFTLEETDNRDATLKYHDGNDDSVLADICAFSSPTVTKIESHSVQCATRYTDTEGFGATLLRHKHDHYAANDSGLYAENKPLLIYPKVQLKLLLTDKLLTDGINLATPPYTNKNGDPGPASLQNLALRYSIELNTHLQDVSNRLEELRWTWNLAQTSEDSDLRSVYSPVMIHHTSPSSIQPPQQRGTPAKCDAADKCSGRDSIEPCLVESPLRSNNLVPDYIRVDGNGICCMLPSTIRVVTTDNGTKRKGKILGWLSKSSKKSLKKYSYKMKKGTELNAKDITMSEEDRMALMLMVKEGRISQDVALEVVKRFELSKKMRPLNGSPKSLSGASSTSSSPWNSPVIRTPQGGNVDDAESYIYNHGDIKCASCMRGEPHNYADTGCLYGRCRSSRSAQHYRSMTHVSTYDCAQSPLSSVYGGYSPHRSVMHSPNLTPRHSAPSNRLPSCRDRNGAQLRKDRYPRMTTSPASSGSDTSVDCLTSRHLHADIMTPRTADMVYPSTNSSSLSVGSESSPFARSIDYRSSHGRSSLEETRLDEPVYAEQSRLGTAMRAGRPRTVDELLARIGLAHLSGMFKRNGYNTLERFVEIYDQDLNALGINDSEQRVKILTAAELLTDFDLSVMGDNNVYSTAMPSDLLRLSPARCNNNDNFDRKDSGCYDSNDNQHYDSGVVQPFASCHRTAMVPDKSDATNGTSCQVHVHGADETDEDREVCGITANSIQERKLPDNSWNFPERATKLPENICINSGKSPDSLLNIQEIFYSLPSNCHSSEKHEEQQSIRNSNELGNQIDKSSPTVINKNDPSATLCEINRSAPKFHRYCETVIKNGAEVVHVKGSGSRESSDCTSSDLSDSAPFRKTLRSGSVKKKGAICRNGYHPTKHDKGDNISVKSTDCLFTDEDANVAIKPRSQQSPSRCNIRTSYPKSPSRVHCSVSNGVCGNQQLEREVPQNLMTSSFNANLRPKNAIFDVSQYVINKDTDSRLSKTSDKTVASENLRKSADQIKTSSSCAIDQCPEVYRFPENRPVSVDDLLATINLQEYGESFRRCGYIHATQLLLLKETDLRDVGIGDHKHLARLLHSLDVLRMKHASPTRAPTSHAPLKHDRV